MLHAYPYLSPSIKGSFAHYTLIHRVPLILDQLIRDWPAMAGPIGSLKEEIRHNRVIQTFSAPWEDLKDWESFFAHYGGYKWQSLPFYPLEAYLYRRILDAGYREKGADWDPFFPIKSEDLERNIPRMQQLWKLLQARRETPLSIFLELALNGNQADLSQVQQGGKQDPFAGLQKEHILVDDRKAALALLQDPQRKRLHYVLDNAGTELYHDMLLINQLLDKEVVEEIFVHAKRLPTFVSDTTLKDWRHTIRTLENALPRLAENLSAWEEMGSLHLTDHPFWNQPYGFQKWPKSLMKDWGSTDYLITKGDANYRRILGDRMLPHTLDSDAITYLPIPLLAIRTLKSEIQIGMLDETVERAKQADPDWLTDGKWGVFQLFKGARSLERA